MAGIGSIQKRGKNSYRLIVSAGFDADGRHIRHLKTVRVRNKTEAKQALNEFYNEVMSADYVVPQKMKLDAFIQEWHAKWAKRNLHENTLIVYSDHIDNHIAPKLGQMRLDHIKTINLVSFMDGLKRKDGKGELAPNTRIDIYNVLLSIFRKALDWKIIQYNPMVGVDRPKSERVRKIEVYEIDEINALLSALQEDTKPGREEDRKKGIRLPAPLHYQLIIKLALYMGLRRGEILGLEWSRINFDRGTLDINQAWSRGKIKPPKNKASYRLLQLPDDLLGEIKQYEMHWRKMIIDTGLITNFVFPESDAMPIKERALDQWLKRFQERHHLRRFSMHQLRHTYVALAISQGIHIKDISEQLGHAQIKTTMDTYGHILNTTKQETANKMNSLIRSMQG